MERSPKRRGQKAFLIWHLSLQAALLSLFCDSGDLLFIIVCWGVVGTRNQLLHWLHKQNLSAVRFSLWFILKVIAIETALGTQRLFMSMIKKIKKYCRKTAETANGFCAPWIQPHISQVKWKSLLVTPVESLAGCFRQYVLSDCLQVLARLQTNYGFLQWLEVPGGMSVEDTLRLQLFFLFLNGPWL